MKPGTGCVNDSSSILLSSKSLLNVSPDLLLGLMICFVFPFFFLLLNPSGRGRSVAADPAPACTQECTIEKALHRKPFQPFQPVIRSSLSSPIPSPSPISLSFFFLPSVPLSLSKWHAHQRTQTPTHRTSTQTHTRNHRLQFVAM